MAHIHSHSIEEIVFVSRSELKRAICDVGGKRTGLCTLTM